MQEQAVVQPPTGAPNAIEVVELKKRYGVGEDAVYALRGMNFAIRNGEFVCIIGPSGCGKTTLLNILGALDRPTSGKVFIDGVDISKMPNVDLARVRSMKLGFVFQDFNLISRMSVIDNVMLPQLIAGVDPEKGKKRALMLLKMLGIGHKAKKSVLAISGGERQRVAVARALANDPRIVLADEPTGNLDTKNTEMMMTLLKQLHEEFGKTLVVITHNPDVARRAQRVIAILDGAVTRITEN